MSQRHVILVVDDDPDLRATIVDLLEDQGYDVLVAANGVTALQALSTASTQPCLILLDLMMPIMDGYTFRAEQMKRPEWAGIPVVLMTAHREIGEDVRGLALELLAKPVGMDTLVAAARRYCPRSADA